MCVAALGAVASVMSSVAGFAAAQQDYEAKAAQWRQNFTNAMAAGVDSQKQIALRFEQEGDLYAQKSQLQEVERAEAAALAEVSAAEGGVGGNVVDNLVNGLARDAARNQTALKENYMNTVQQLQQENTATETTIMNQINSVQRPVAPNPLGYIASGIGGALKALPTSTTENIA